MRAICIEAVVILEAVWVTLTIFDTTFCVRFGCSGCGRRPPVFELLRVIRFVRKFVNGLSFEYSGVDITALFKSSCYYFV